MAEAPASIQQSIQKDVSLATTMGSKMSAEEIKTDHVENPKPPDLAAAVASRFQRTVIFFAFCQGVQCFMSYDGGATPASLDTIQVEMNYAWTEAEFGFLGSVDKLGMTVTSLIWGRALQLCNVKLLMISGLFVNAACTLGFGSLRNKSAMYIAKLLMGATQSLQGVWGTVWTVNMAPPDCKTMWLGLGGVSAGLGNGVGTAVAGFGTANGLPYAFAFQLQAGVLFVLWVLLMLCPARWLTMTLPGTQEMKVLEPDFPSEKACGIGSTAHGTRAQLRQLAGNRLFILTSLQISLVMFQVSGIQFLWVRFFVSVWKLDKNWVTTMYLLVAGAGGGIGIAMGPAYIDKIGGYNTPLGVRRTVRALETFSWAACAFAALGVVCVYFKQLQIENVWGQWGDHWLWLIWLALGVIHAAHQASVPALCGLNIEMVLPQNRTLAAGVEMTIRNILGFSFGPLLPAMFMALLEWQWGWDTQTDARQQQKILCYGMGFILVVNAFGIAIMRRASQTATLYLAEKQRVAMKELREAFKSEDKKSIESSLRRCRGNELEHTPGGHAVMSAATDFLASNRARPRLSSDELDEHHVAMDQHHKAMRSKMGVSELRQLVVELEAEVEQTQRVKKEIKDLKLQMDNLRADNARLETDKQALQNRIDRVEHNSKVPAKMFL